MKAISPYQIQLAPNCVTVSKGLYWGLSKKSCIFADYLETASGIDL